LRSTPVSDGSGVGIEVLFDTSEDQPTPLPDELERLYAGPLGLPERGVLANFVTSIDGVAAIEDVRRSSATISGGSPADRFVVGLLRAVADAVVVGSGTLREHDGPWTAERAFPDAANAFAEARRKLDLPRTPTLVVVTASGRLPAGHPSLADAVVVTTAAGARTVAETSVPSREVVEVDGHGDVDPASIVAAVRERGFERILTEGGPRLMGSMLEASLVDELFVTLAPSLLGGGAGRSPLSDDTQLATGARLVSVRRAGEHLLVRYGLSGNEAAA